MGEVSAAEEQQASPGPHRVPRRWRLGEEARPRGGRSSRAPVAAKFSTIPQGARPGAGSRRSAPGASSECGEAGSASEEEEQGVRARRTRRAGSLRGRRVGGGDGRGGGRGLGLFLGASPVLAAAALAPRRRLTSDLAGNSACLRASAPRRSPERGWSRRRHTTHHLSGRPARPSLRLAHSLRAAGGPARPPPAPSSPPAFSRHRRHQAGHGAAQHGAARRPACAPPRRALGSGAALRPPPARAGQRPRPRRLAAAARPGPRHAGLKAAAV